MIDEEIRSIIDRNYQRAEQLLKSNIDKLHIMAKALIKYETLNSDQIDDIMLVKNPIHLKIGMMNMPPTTEEHKSNVQNNTSPLSSASAEANESKN